MYAFAFRHQPGIPVESDADSIPVESEPGSGAGEIGVALYGNARLVAKAKAYMLKASNEPNGPNGPFPSLCPFLPSGVLRCGADGVGTLVPLVVSQACRLNRGRIRCMQRSAL
eukprot:8412869-Pyramimonas_sp.AAC.1